MTDAYIKYIAERLQLASWQVENCVELLEEGATIPFISRYRKERTGGIDETYVAQIKHYYLYALQREETQLHPPELKHKPP